MIHSKQVYSPHIQMQANFLMGILFFMQEKPHSKEEITFSDADSEQCQRATLVQTLQRNSPNHEMLLIKDNETIQNCQNEHTYHQEQNKIQFEKNGTIQMQDIEKQKVFQNNVQNTGLMQQNNINNDAYQYDFNGQIPKEKGNCQQQELTEIHHEERKELFLQQNTPAGHKNEVISQQKQQQLQISTIKTNIQNLQQNLAKNHEQQFNKPIAQIQTPAIIPNQDNSMKDLEPDENAKQAETEQNANTVELQQKENKGEQLSSNVQFKQKNSISQDEGNSVLLTTQMIKKKKEVEVINLDDEEANKQPQQEQELKQIQACQANETICEKQNTIEKSIEKKVDTLIDKPTENQCQKQIEQKQIIQVQDTNAHAPPTLKPHSKQQAKKTISQIGAPSFSPVHKIVISPEKSGAKITFVSNTNCIYFQVFEPLTNRYFNAYITNEQVQEFDKKLISKSEKKISLFKDLAQFYQYLYTTTNFLLKAPGEMNEKDRRLSNFINVDHSQMLLKIHILEEKDFDNLVFSTKIRQIGKQSIQVEFNERTLQLNAKTNQFIKNVKDLEHRVYDLEKYKKQRANQTSIDPQKLKKYLFDFHTRLTDQHSQIQSLKQQNNQLKTMIEDLKTRESYQQINTDFYEQLKSMHKNLSFLMLRSGFGEIAQQSGTDYLLERCSSYQWNFQNDPQFYDISFNKETREFQAQGMADDTNQTEEGGKPTTWKCITVTNQFSDTQPIIYFSIKIVKIANTQKSFGFQLGIRNQTWATCVSEQCCKNIIVYESGGLKNHGKVWNSKQWEKVSICTAHCRKVWQGDILTGILDRRDAHSHKFIWYKNNTKLVEIKLPIQMRSEKIYPLLGLWGPGDKIKIV